MKALTVGTKRLMKEHKDILEKPNANFVAEPDPDNIFDWHYCIYALKGCPYEGGYYHGMLKFPKEYPLKPPSVIMLTPSGRFEPNARICLTISDWHPEQWNPVWKVESIIMGLLSFMLSEEHSVASLHESEAVRKKFAKESLNWNLKKNPSGRFETIFEKHLVRLGIREGKVEEPLKKVASTKDKEEEKKGKEEEKKAGDLELPKLGKRASSKKEAEAPKKEAPKEAPAANPKKREAKEEEKKQNVAPAKAPKAAPAKPEGDFLYVQCIKVGPKIRLRIVNSTCYNNNWNCQGPRSIRREGVVYRIDNPKVKVMYGGPGKASFYKLSNDTSIYKLVLEGAVSKMSKEDLKKKGLKIFEESDCVVCLVEKPNMVFDICGHMCICKACFSMNKSSNKCVMCNTVNKNAFIAEDGEVDGDGDDD
jgi:ubiquitin-conjugating enzyme E2 J2